MMGDNTESVKVKPQKMDSGWDNAQLLGVLVAVIAVLLTLFIYASYRKTHGKRNGLLLLGLSDSGKTLLFARLLHGKFVQTYTSITESAGDYLVKRTVLKVVDIPGHERLRQKFFDMFKSSARGLVFVVDSGTIQRDIKDAAEYLYYCLSDNVVRKNLPSILILCNKQDEPLAKGGSVIKAMLEKEMNILRTTKTNRLMSLGDSVNEVYLGKEGKDFEFSHLSPMKVDFAESCAVVQADDTPVQMKELTDWIQSIA